MSESSAGMIQSGFSSLGQGLQQEHEDNAPLTPTQKWLSAVLQGRVSPEVGAMQAKIEHLQTGTPFHPTMTPQGLEHLSAQPPSKLSEDSAPDRLGMTGDEISNPFPSRAAGAVGPSMVTGSDNIPQLAPNQQQGMFPATPQGALVAPSPDTSAPPLARLNYGGASEAPVPRNNKEYQQLVKGAEVLGAQRLANPNQLTFAEREQLQKEKYGPQGIGQLISQKGDQATSLQTLKGSQSDARTQKRLDAQAALGEARNSTALKIAGGRNAVSLATSQQRADTAGNIAAGKDALTTSVATLRAMTQRAASLEAARAKILSSFSANDPAAKKSLKQIDADLAKVRSAAAYHVDTIEKLTSTPVDENADETPSLTPAE